MADPSTESSILPRLNHATPTLNQELTRSARFATYLAVPYLLPVLGLAEAGSEETPRDTDYDTRASQMTKNIHSDGCCSFIFSKLYETFFFVSIAKH